MPRLLLDSVGNVGQYCSLVALPSGQPGVCYSNDTLPAVRYIRQVAP